MNTREVRTFAANNPYVQEYYASRDRQYPPGTISIPFGKVDVATFRRNTAYREAWETMARKFPAVFKEFGSTGIYHHHTFYFDIDRCLFALDFQLSAQLKWNGEYRICISSNNGNARFFTKYDAYHTESMEWSREALIKKAEEIIRSQLLGTGYFARLQIRYQLPKYKLKDKIRELYKESKQTTIEISRLHKWIRRKFNIDGSNIWDEQKLIEVVNQHGKQRTLVKVAYYNSSWFYDFEGDVDELEREFYQNIEENTIYI